MNSGVYIISHLDSAKVYVGSTYDITGRWKRHKQNLNANHHHNIKLQNAWNKYGEESFSFEVLELLPSRLLVEREQFWMDSYDVVNTGYNIHPQARSALGTKRSKESIMKMREAAKLRIANNPYYKTKGRTHSLETRKKLSDNHKGKRTGKDNHNFGKKASEYCKTQAIKATAKYYVVTRPDGTEEQIFGLREYCRKHNLDHGSMSKVLAAKCRHHKQYKIKYL